jgi:hypothetical protein
LTGSIRVALRPAPRWAILILLVHALAAAGAFLALPWPGAAFAVAGLALSAWAGAGAALARAPFGIREIELKPDGSAAYVDAHGEWREARVTSTGALGHWMATLVLRDGRCRHALVLFEGAVDADTFRRARVWLRWRAAMPARAQNDPQIR